MRIFAAVLMAAVVFAGPALANTTEGTDAGWTFINPEGGPMWAGARDVLYDNGPFVNSVGTGFGGADESVLQNISLGMGTYGYGHQIFYDYRIADDFVVPAGETWTLEGVTFFAYQTNSTTTSTITEVHFELWDNIPPGGNILYGDMATNQMIATGWTNCYRVLEDSMGQATNRPIMADECAFTPAQTIGEGQYWFAWQTDGTLSSGPWAGPIAIWDVPSTGDGLQSTDGGATYVPITDGGNLMPQGFPFIINGYMGGTPVDETTWGHVKTLFK
jgi:hypothetical protein